MKRNLIIFFLVAALLLAGCSKTNTNTLTGDVVKEEARENTLENTYDCAGKKKALQDESTLMKDELEKINTQISDKLNELRKANTEDEQTSAANALRDLRKQKRELEASIETLDLAIDGMTCQ